MPAVRTSGAADHRNFAAAGCSKEHDSAGFARMLKQVLLAVLVLFAVTASAAEDKSALVAALQQGGLVIYFRHADTGPATLEPPTVVMGRCETQRNLNDNGRAQARAIGASFKTLRIPVSKVLSSEFCRCWQTAELAFGRYEIARTLTGVRRDPAYEKDRQAAIDGLRALLGTPPAAGHNNVLVAHGFNLIDLEGLYLSTQGEAAVYQPDARGGYRLIARVLPEEWTELAAALAR